MSNLDVYVPFDQGAGAAATPDHWRRMARGWEYNGVVPGYGQQFSASIANGILTLGTGAVWVDGFYGEVTTSKSVSSTGLGPGLVCARVDPTARTISFVYENATTGIVFTQSLTGVYDIPLYHVDSATGFTDMRQFTTATADWTVSGQPYPAYWRNGAYSTSTANTVYGFDSIAWGNQFFSNSYTFVCPYADDYLCIAQIGFNPTAANQWYNLVICRNAVGLGETGFAWHGLNAPYAGAYTTCTAKDIIPCKTGDSLYVRHWASTAGCSGLTGYAYAFMNIRAMSR
jgi:hypothetical protein